MTYRFVFAFFFIVTLQLSAQIDNSNGGGILIPAIETKEKDSLPKAIQIKPNPSKPSLTSQKSISGIPFKTKVKITEHKEEFSMFDDNNLVNPGSIYEDRWKKKAVEQQIRPEYMEDVFLGDYKVKTDMVNIMCRDHGLPDGDNVRITINDQVYIPLLTLTGNYKSFNVPLVPGFNRIEFLALNQGTSGPNTAQFQVYDDRGNLVSSKSWNLLTGVKATIIVTKEVETITPNEE